MADVFKVVYEVSPDHPAVVAHFAAVEVAASATWAYVESVGALGYYTSSWDGSLHGVVFTGAVPPEWKVLERVYHPNADKALLCMPKKTKAAAEVKAAFDAVPAIPKSEILARDLGWSKRHREVMDGNKVYFATVHKLDLPTPRVFVRVPRQIGDGWEAPDFWTERTEGDYMRAVAAHNALVPPDAPPA